MGLFNWFSWQLERRELKQRIDSLMSDLHQTMQEVTELRIASHEAQLLLHDAERGAKLAAEEQDKLKTQLDLHKSAAEYWENVARNQQRWIAELRRPASELTSVIETTEPVESELERLAREIYIHTTDMSGDLLSPVDAFEMAINFIKYRDRKRNEKENQTDGK